MSTATAASVPPQEWPVSIVYVHSIIYTSVLFDTDSEYLPISNYIFRKKTSDFWQTQILVFFAYPFVHLLYMHLSLDTDDTNPLGRQPGDRCLRPAQAPSTPLVTFYSNRSVTVTWNAGEGPVPEKLGDIKMWKTMKNTKVSLNKNP